MHDSALTVAERRREIVNVLADALLALLLRRGSSSEPAKPAATSPSASACALPKRETAIP